MGRILSIDYGGKRTGLAVTDPLKMIATGLETVPTEKLIIYLDKYFQEEDVESIVIGMPKNLDNTETHNTAPVKEFILKLQSKFPDKPIHEVDERFTSKIATDAMVRGGMKKKDRRKKENIDKLSAVIILQSFLDTQTFM